MTDRRRPYDPEPHPPRRGRLEDVLGMSAAVAARLEDAADRLEQAVDALDRRITSTPPGPHTGRRRTDLKDDDDG